MDDEINSSHGDDEGAQEEERILAEYKDRYQPQAYRQVFYPPQAGEWKVDALFPDGFFESAMVILDGVENGRLLEGIHGVAGVFLSRHYLELALKYTLFHSRWLKDEVTNAADHEVGPVGKYEGHKLRPLLDKLLAELKIRTPSIAAIGLDLNFVTEFVKEFHEVDERGIRFRYPGEQLAAGRSTNETLGIDFSRLLSNLKRVHDILWTLDNHLIEQYGQNEDRANFAW